MLGDELHYKVITNNNLRTSKAQLEEQKEEDDTNHEMELMKLQDKLDEVKVQLEEAEEKLDDGERIRDSLDCYLSEENDQEYSDDDEVSDDDMDL
jgi:hypothetical protein